MASPSINGQLGWDNGFAHYILAWDHHAGQPRIAQRVKLEYQYNSSEPTEKQVDFVVDYVPRGAEKTIKSFDEKLQVTIPKRNHSNGYDPNVTELYVAIATGYVGTDVELPAGLHLVENPYYITALSPTQGKELLELPWPIRIELNDKARLNELYYLTSYLTYSGEEVSHWVKVSNPANVRSLGIYAILQDNGK